MHDRVLSQLETRHVVLMMDDDLPRMRLGRRHESIISSILFQENERTLKSRLHFKMTADGTQSFDVIN